MKKIARLGIKRARSLLRREEPFHMKLRICNEFSDERFIEMRGVPVYEADGRFRPPSSVSTSMYPKLHSQPWSSKNITLKLSRKNFMLTTALSDLEANFTAMVESLVKAVEAKDPYTAGHF